MAVVHTTTRATRAARGTIHGLRGQHMRLFHRGCGRVSCIAGRGVRRPGEKESCLGYRGIQRERRRRGFWRGAAGRDLSADSDVDVKLEAIESGAEVEEERTAHEETAWRPPPWMFRGMYALVTAGTVVKRLLSGKVHVKNTIQQLRIVGPASLGVSLLTSGFVGMVFTIQFVREFTKLGLTRSIGGVLALALSRELTPVVTAIIFAGRVGSAFAAELGTMQVSEQTDSLRVLRSDPVDYLVLPRVVACAIAMPIVTLICFSVGMGAAVFLAESVYDVSANVIIDSAMKALQPLDLIAMIIKSLVFGGIISIVSCSWGSTTSGGARGVGDSTTSAVVISLVSLFVSDFFMSFAFFQGQSDALKACL